MGKIGKKLIYKRGGKQHNISLYNSTNDVGSNYITLRVDGQLVYAQIASPGSEATTGLIVKSGGKKFAVRSSTQDLTLISKGTVGGTGVVAPAPTNVKGTYFGSGNNVAATWYSKATWTEPDDSKLMCEFTITISPSISLSDVDHYRLKYNKDSLVMSESAGTIVKTARTWKIQLSPGSWFFRVDAEDVNNNVLYSSPIYGPVTTPYSTKVAAGVKYTVEKSDSAGNNKVTIGTYNTGVTESANYLNDANTKKWFFVTTSTASPWAGDTGKRTTNITCADTCTCNCNYCTCNCNYCTCNCNYCTCNCDYSPCSCSSGN